MNADTHYFYARPGATPPGAGASPRAAAILRAVDGLDRCAAARGVTSEELLAAWVAQDGPTRSATATADEPLVLPAGYLDALARIAAARGMTPAALVMWWIIDAPLEAPPAEARAALAYAPPGALERLMANVAAYDAARARR